MLILVSNDDGFFTDGIKTLADALRKIGEVWIVAPDREQSAAGHSLTLHRPIRVKRTRKEIHEYAVDGTPTDCVNVAINRLMPRKPDIVVSGINRGANLGDDVTYSGTVAAALEAALLGVPAIAVSAVGLTDASDEYRYEAAADFAAYLAQKTLKHGLDPGMILNVNVPSETVVGERMSVI
jgi:5'-nucleotidase